MDFLKVVNTLFLILFNFPPSHPWNPDFIYKTVISVTQFVKTQELLMFYCADCKDERLDYMVGRIIRTSGLPQYVQTNFTNYELRYLTKRNYLAIIFTHSIDDFIFKVHHQTLLGLHYYLGMVVLLDPIDNLDIIEKILFSLYKKRFTNTHVYFASSNSTDNFYGFETYPTFKVEDRISWTIDLKRALQYFRRGVHGHAFKTPLQADAPRVFTFRNHAGQMEVQGTSYRIFKTFVKYMNGAINQYMMGNSTQAVNMKEVLQLIKDDKIEISAHSYAMYDQTEIDQSYPLLVLQSCIMVPSFNKITTYLYPIKPFEWKVWLLCFITILAIIATNYCYRKLFSKKTSFSGICLSAFCIILNIAAPETFRNPSKWEFFFLSVVFLLTAVVTFYYVSFLGSILTVNLFRPQINTIDDLIAANIPVMMIDYEYEFLRNFTQLSLEFEQLIYPVDPDTFSKHRDYMNSTYAYLTTDERWHFIALQQKYLKHPKFRLSDICFGSFHMGFPMQIDSPVWRDLEYFIYRIHSSGLYHHYESIAYDYAVQGGYAHRLTSQNEYQSAGMEHLRMAFQVLLFLYGISLLVFIYELIIKAKKK